MAKKKMPMTTVNGKKVPAFAADGKGASDMKKGSAATMKKKSMAKITAKQKSKLNPGLVAAIKKDEGVAMKMKKAAMKLKKESTMMMKKAAMKMKKVSAMKMKMKKK
jgi:hypothetical protein